MTLSNQKEKNIQAFIVALSEQSESLPSNLQANLQSIGQNLQSRTVEIPAIAASLPQLNNTYQQALSNLQPNSQPNEEKKNIKLVSSSQADSGAQRLEQATKILTSSDPVQAAQKNNSRSSRQIAFTPFRRFFSKG